MILIHELGFTEHSISRTLEDIKKATKETNDFKQHIHILKSIQRMYRDLRTLETIENELSEKLFKI